MRGWARAWRTEGEGDWIAEARGVASAGDGTLGFGAPSGSWQDPASCIPP